MGRAVQPHIITSDSALGGSVIERSVRLDGVDGHFYRTPSVNGNRQKFTFSLWVKRGKISNDDQHFMRCSTREAAFRIENTDKLQFYFSNAAGTYHHVKSNALFFDMGTWYHLMAVVDTTQATESNRVKMYVNGEQITSLS